MAARKSLVVLCLVVLALVVVGAYRRAQQEPQKPHAVTLHWQATPGATSYNIYRRTGKTDFVKIGTSQTTTYIDTPVPGGAVLYYAVTSVQRKEESRYSDVIRAEVPKDQWF